MRKGSRRCTAALFMGVTVWGPASAEAPTRGAMLRSRLERRRGPSFSACARRLRSRTTKSRMAALRPEWNEWRASSRCRCRGRPGDRRTSATQGSQDAARPHREVTRGPFTCREREDAVSVGTRGHASPAPNEVTGRGSTRTIPTIRTSSTAGDCGERTRRCSCSGPHRPR